MATLSGLCIKNSQQAYRVGITTSNTGYLDWTVCEVDNKDIAFIIIPILMSADIGDLFKQNFTYSPPSILSIFVYKI